VIFARARRFFSSEISLRVGQHLSYPGWQDCAHETDSCAARRPPKPFSGAEKSFARARATVAGVRQPFFQASESSVRTSELLADAGEAVSHARESFADASDAFTGTGKPFRHARQPFFRARKSFAGGGKSFPARRGKRTNTQQTSK
jgi:hypothetical protein